MKATFITTGEYEVIALDSGLVYYYVGRKGMEPIHLLSFIREYGQEGKHIMIDPYGTPWVRGDVL